MSSTAGSALFTTLTSTSPSLFTLNPNILHIHHVSRDIPVQIDGSIIAGIIGGAGSILILGGYILYRRCNRAVKETQPQPLTVQPFNLKYYANINSAQTVSGSPTDTLPPEPSSRPRPPPRTRLPPLPTSTPGSTTMERTRRGRHAIRRPQTDNNPDVMTKLRLQIMEEQLSALGYEINSRGYDPNNREIARLHAKVVELRELYDGDARTLVNSSRRPTLISMPTLTPTPTTPVPTATEHITHSAG